MSGGSKLGDQGSGKGALALAVVLPILCLSAATRLEDLSVVWPAAWGMYLAAFVGWGALLWAWKSGRWRLTLGQALLGAVVLRVIMLPSEPLFSDDIWRYIWDGHVQRSGLNPYRFAPADPALAELHNAVWPKINHPEVPTIYPPVAQIVFGISAWLGGGMLPLRLAVILCEVLALVAAWRLTEPRDHRETPARAKDRKAALTLLILWNPLMVVEFSGSGHLDAMAIAPLMWALALVVPRRDEPDGIQAPLSARPWLWAGVCVGLSAGAKLLGVLLVPLLLAWAWWPRRWPERDGRPAGSLKRSAALLVGASLAVGATSAPYVTTIVFEETGTFGKGLTTYVRKWRANDGLFGAMVATEQAILSHAPGAEEGPDRPWWRFDVLQRPFEALGITQVHEGAEVASTTFTRRELELSLVKAFVAMFLGFLLLFLLHQRIEASAATLVLLGGLLLMAPTVHPWYVAWLVPLAAVHRARSMLLWSALVALAYASALTFALEGRWHEPVWIKVVEYLPVFVVLALEASRRLAGVHPPPLWRAHESPD